MRIKLKDELLLQNILVVLLIIIIVFFPSFVLRVILGLPLMLFIPGYSLMAALFPAKSGMGGVERTLLSLGLSIVVTTIIGLFLNFTPWGIGLFSVLISLAMFIFFVSLIAWYRRYRLPEGDRLSVFSNFRPGTWRAKSFPDKVLSCFLITAILGVLGLMVYTMVFPGVGEKFTAFSIITLEGAASDYPRVLEVGEVGTVKVEIANYEKEDVEYRIEVRIDGIKNNETGYIRIGDEQKWEEKVDFTPKKAGDDQKVEFILYKNMDADPYSSVHFWVNVEE